MYMNYIYYIYIFIYINIYMNIYVEYIYAVIFTRLVWKVGIFSEAEVRGKYSLPRVGGILSIFHNKG